MSDLDEYLNNDKFLEIKDELQKEKRIFVTDEWLVNSLKNLNAFSEGSKISYTHIYRLWLSTDIRLIGTSLPSNLTIPNVFFIPCSFNCKDVFQINSVRDISKPDFELDEFLQVEQEDYEEKENSNTYQSNYSKKNNSNSKFEDKGFQKSKGTRMISMTLFDGSREIQAIEYNPIPSITHESCYPGAKILVKGSVEISLNILFLKPENIELLGGSKLPNDKKQNCGQIQN